MVRFHTEEHHYDLAVAKLKELSECLFLLHQLKKDFYIRIVEKSFQNTVYYDKLTFTRKIIIQ